MRYLLTTLIVSVLIGTASLTHAQSTTTVQVSGEGEVDFSSTYAFKRNGVFGCSLNGSYSMSVGALSAVGGVYVPVNDAAVTLNTGYLVYKECVLRGVVNRQREAASTGISKQVIVTVTTGKDGNPYYSQRQRDENTTVRDQAFLRVLQGGAMESLNPSYKNQVSRAVANTYLQARNGPYKVLECPYPGDIRSAIENGNDFKLSNLTYMMNPACNPYGAYRLAIEYAEDMANYDVQNLRDRLAWGNGFYGVEECDQYGNCTVVTPGSIVRGNFTQALQTGFDQLSRANDIDQMVGALFSGMISQVIGDNRGIAGLTQKTGSQSSYIDQVVREAAQGLRDAAVNAALTSLTGARTIEQGYRTIGLQISDVLAGTIIELRGKEAACWNLVVQSVCDGSLATDKTCTEKVVCTGSSDNAVCPSGGKLKVATSTVFSDAVITERVRPLASSTVESLAKSEQAITLVDRLIAGITNTTSLDAQRVALQQLDNLVANRLVRTNEAALQAAQKAVDDVKASQETLRTDTVKKWADDAPNGSDFTATNQTGWCNVNSATTLAKWKQKWKQ